VLLSESQDRRLSWSRRWALRLHLAMCGLCRTSARQWRALRGALRSYAGDAAFDDGAARLSEEARGRIRQSLGKARRLSKRESDSGGTEGAQ